jgi:hypothetical protein
MDEQTRLLALAHLHNGTKPADTAELTGISYASAIKLRKELHAAEQKDRIRDLFKLDKAALDILLDSVRKQMVPAIDAFGVGDAVEKEVNGIAKGIEGGQLLDQQFQESASAIANKITSVAMASSNADTLLSLSKALCELQRAFFAPDSASPSNIPLSSFEQHLKN